jgi:molybdate transport system ATP-binding protein
VSALDEPARWEALSLIERATRQFAVPALFVSHQRTEVARIARETARIVDGRIVARGETATVLADTRDAGSIPNLLRAVHITEQLAELTGGAIVQLPRPGTPGKEVWCRLASGAIALGGLDGAGGQSPRNRIPGRVVAVDETAGRVRVAVDIGVVVHADVTPETARHFGLRAGAVVACVFKVHSLEVLP